MIAKIVLFLALVLIPCAGWGAVTVDGNAAVTGTTSGTTTLTLNRATAGSNRIGFACYTWTDQGNTISTPTWNGSNMTLVDTAFESCCAGQRASLYYILNPPTGASNVVTTPNSSVAAMRGTVFSVQDADVSGTPLGTAVSGTNGGGTWASSPISDTVTTAAGELIVDCLGWTQNDTTPPTVGANQTQLANNGHYLAGSHFNAVSHQAGADGGVMSWTFTGIGAWGHVAVPVKAAAAGGSTVRNLMLLGVGQ